MYYPLHLIGDFKLSKLILPLLQIIMFGMGTELSLKEFRTQCRPHAHRRLIGVIYTIMPCQLYAGRHLPLPQRDNGRHHLVAPVRRTGLDNHVLSGKANLALSVSVTAISTLLAPFLTPLLMKVLAGQYIDVHLGAMVWDITQIVIIATPGFHYLVRGRFAWLDRVGHRLSP